MDKAEVIEKIKEMHNPRGVEIWARAGVSPDNYFGVGLTKLKKLAGKVKKNHELALELWDPGIHEGKLLATMIEKPKMVTEQQIQKQIRDIYTWDLADKYCENVVSKTGYAIKFIEQWVKSESEMIRRSAYILLRLLAKARSDIDDMFFMKYLERIEKTLQKEENWVKDGMNYALIEIGKRNDVLKDETLKVLDSVGEIVVDYGDSSCKTPDAKGIILNR